MGNCIFEISYSVDSLSFKLSISNTSDLKAHEEIIPSLLREIKQSLIDNNALFDPIIIDCKLGLVIDGVHRLIALKDLGFELTPAINVNYLNEGIRVGRWFRVLRDLNLSILKDYKISTAEISYNDFLITLDSSQACLGVFSNNKAYLIEEDLDAFQISYLLDRFSRYVVKFVPENIVNEEDIVLGYRRITKDEIIACIQENNKFTYKFTRHIIPVRVLSLNIPLSLLKYEKVEKLKNILSNLKFRYLGDNLIIDNRFYEEKVVIREI